MSTTARFAEIAALAGDPARAAMLQALMDGRALTAAELARHAGVTPQTASGHLARLVGAGMLSVAAQGRHRYHRLASPAVARALEGLMQLAAAPAPRGRPAVDTPLRRARTCYDHLAGRLGVALADALAASGHVEFDTETAEITPSGLALFARHGIGLDGPRRRMLCRPCLDWTERRSHLAGTLGAALCRHCLDHGWVRRLPGTRALHITPAGAGALRAAFGVVMP